MKTTRIGAAALVLASAAAAGELPKGIHIKIDEARIRAHQIRPSDIGVVESDSGPEDTIADIPIQVPGPIFEPSFDVKGFGDDLRDQLKAAVQGFAFEVRQAGTKVYGWHYQWARTPSDGSENWALESNMHVASLSKMITADLMTKALDDNKISYDAAIYKYLPAYWSRGPNIDKITFRELMTHTSGFNTGGSTSDFQTMETAVANGVTSIGTYHYENMNFGICRVLLAVIVGAIDRDAVTAPFPPDWAWEAVTLVNYESWAAQYVFVPSGVSDYSLDHPANGVLAYNIPTTLPGWNSGGLEYMAGAAGWHLTTEDVLNVMGTVRRAGTILPKAKAQGMLDAKFGIDRVQSTPLGKLYCKNGIWRTGPSGPSRREEQSVACYLPQDMEVVLFANSPISPGSSGLTGMVINTYQKHIVPKRVGP